MNVKIWLGEPEIYLRHVKRRANILSSPLSGASYASWRESSSSSKGSQFGYMAGMVGDVAVVDVKGDLTNTYSPDNRYYDEVSYPEIQGAVAESVSAGARAILMDIGTGGGDSSGINNLTEYMEDVSSGGVPIYTYTGTEALSGGYWLGVTGKEKFAGSMAWLGSIGAITVHISRKRMMEEAGIDGTVLREGEFKSLGTSLEELTPEAKADIQSKLSRVNSHFLSHVSKHLGVDVETLKATVANGKMFLGAEAKAVGLVDHITTFNGALQRVSDKVSAEKRSTVYQRGQVGMKTEQQLALESTGTGAGEGDSESQVTVILAADQPDVTLAAPQPAAQPSMDMAMLDRLTDVSAKLAVATHEAQQLRGELAAAKADNEGLVKLAVLSINDVMVRLGQRGSASTADGASSLIAKHHQVWSDFNSRFKAGAVAESVTSDENLAPSGGYVPRGAVKI